MWGLARTKANLHSSVCFFPSLIKTSSSCGLSQLLDVLVKQLLEISSGSCCSRVCQLVLGIVVLGWVPVGGWIPHRACPTQHFCVRQTTSVNVCHRCCVRLLDSLLRWEGQGNVFFFERGVGRFGYSGRRRGFFLVFDNFLGRWRRSRVGLFGDGSLVFGCDDPLDFSLHLGVRSTSLKQN